LQGSGGGNLKERDHLEDLSRRRSEITMKMGVQKIEWGRRLD